MNKFKVIKKQIIIWFCKKKLHFEWLTNEIEINTKLDVKIVKNISRVDLGEKLTISKDLALIEVTSSTKKIRNIMVNNNI